MNTENPPGLVRVIQYDKGRYHPGYPATKGKKKYDQKGATPLSDYGQGRKDDGQQYSQETHFNSYSQLIYLLDTEMDQMLQAKKTLLKEGFFGRRPGCFSPTGSHSIPSRISHFRFTYLFQGVFYVAGGTHYFHKGPHG
jgi:hypothetical protein